MRNKFDTQLEILNTDMIAMGALCENAISRAIKALLTNDKGLAEEVVASDKEVDQKEREIESLCLKLLLQQQPVARDLRQISSALKMITDMERIGDQAADIAEIVHFTDLREGENNIHIADMARATIKMVTESIDAFVKSDLTLVRAVIDYDDVVDELFCKIKSELIAMIGQDTKHGEYALDILMIAKYLERIGDHATNIAEWVEFSITGVHREG